MIFALLGCTDNQTRWCYRELKTQFGALTESFSFQSESLDRSDFSDAYPRSAVYKSQRAFCRAFPRSLRVKTIGCLLSRAGGVLLRQSPGCCLSSSCFIPNFGSLKSSGLGTRCGSSLLERSLSTPPLQGKDRSAKWCTHPPNRFTTLNTWRCEKWRQT